MTTGNHRKINWLHFCGQLFLEGYVCKMSNGFICRRHYTTFRSSFPPAYSWLASGALESGQLRQGLCPKGRNFRWKGMLLGSCPSYTSILPPAPTSGAAGGWLASELRIQDPHFNVPYSLFLQNFSPWVCLSEHDSKSSTPLLHEIHLYLFWVSIISAFAASWNMLMCVCFLAFHWIMTSDSYIALFTYPTEGLASVFACGIWFISQFAWSVSSFTSLFF